MTDRLRERMETTHGMWRLMLAGAVSSPTEFAIIFGMLDSIGQSFGADGQTTQKAMETTLGNATFMLCMAAGHDPTLQPWVIAGGQTAYDMAMGKKGSPNGHIGKTGAPISG